MRIALYIYIGMSLLTLAAYGWDKWAAVRQARRVKERTLHGFAAAGGWPGALLGMQVFRHKRRKRGFRFVVGSIALVHVLLWSAWYALG